MQLLEDISTAIYQIQAYTAGSITINGQVYNHSLIVMPEKLILTWPVATIAELTLPCIEAITTLEPELILIGSGTATINGIEPHLLQPAIQLKISIDVMSTAAACRTYTILAADGRRVAAALII